MRSRAKRPRRLEVDGGPVPGSEPDTGRRPKRRAAERACQVIAAIGEDNTSDDAWIKKVEAEAAREAERKRRTLTSKKGGTTRSTRRRQASTAEIDPKNAQAEFMLRIACSYTDPLSLNALCGVSRWVREAALEETQRRVATKAMPPRMPDLPAAPRTDRELWSGTWLSKTWVQKNYKVSEAHLQRFKSPSVQRHVNIETPMGTVCVLGRFYPRAWVEAVALALEGSPQAWMKKHTRRANGAAVAERKAKVKDAFKGTGIPLDEVLDAAEAFIRSGKGGMRGVRKALEMTGAVNAVAH